MESWLTSPTAGPTHTQELPVPDWRHLNWLSCIFDSLDVRRDGKVQISAFLSRLAGYDPLVSPQTEIEGAENEAGQQGGLPFGAVAVDHHILQWGSGRALIHMDTYENPPLRTGATRLSGAGYIGERRRPPPPLAFLTPEQQVLFDRTNAEIDLLLSWYQLQYGHVYHESPQTLRQMRTLVAQHSGSMHRLEFLDSIIKWRKADAIRAAPVQ
eukprot:jgi/Botrbrau1/1897/Bobra.0005s0013.1